MQSRWSFLEPNTPESTIIHCVNCDASFDVIRNDCSFEACKGNVIHDYDGELNCLTCFETQIE